MTHWQPFLGSRAPSVIPGNAREQERASLQPPACKRTFSPRNVRIVVADEPWGAGASFDQVRPALGSVGVP